VSTTTLSRSDFAQSIEEDGFAIVPHCLDGETVRHVGAHLGETRYAIRNLLALPVIRELAASIAVRTLVEAVLGEHCFGVKGTFFNKTQEANWKVAWHQDLTIMVRERREVAGFGPWTVKEGIVHVQPTTEVLSGILAIRLRLDESGLDNGPLRVIPGSHKPGRLSSAEVADQQKVHGSSERRFVHASVTASRIVRLCDPKAEKSNPSGIFCGRTASRAGVV
jgi:hypothetical protein